jgi:hypothetical protein
MADDDLDYAFGQFGDPNPPGTMTPLGLSPDDPLHDWGSNMKPSDLTQYVHDPQGFVNNMINSGQAPPSHNYVQSPTGRLQAVDQSGAPIRTSAQGRIQGNISDYLGPATGQTAQQAVAAPVAPGGAPRLAYMDPGGGFGQSPEAEALPESGKGTPPSPGSIGGAFIPAPITPQRPPPDLPPLRNPNPVLPGTTPLPRANPTRPAEISEEAGGAPAPATSTPEKKVAEKKAFSPEAVDDFAKSLQGVKMPTRPVWQPMGAPAVRSPVGVQPQIQALLSAIGQGRPSPQQVALMRLLGRA